MSTLCCTDKQKVQALGSSAIGNKKGATCWEMDEPREPLRLRNWKSHWAIPFTQNLPIGKAIETGSTFVVGDAWGLENNGEWQLPGVRPLFQVKDVF